MLFFPSEGYTHCKYATEACLSAAKPIAHTESCQRCATTDIRHPLALTIHKSIRGPIHMQLHRLKWFWRETMHEHLVLLWMCLYIKSSARPHDRSLGHPP
uniref:Uncharacterized protein n=1 Tax=Rhipicephalus appendiculatus TaxID=34631 RepID=A0A131YC25_RHIAP